jgi:hypothetical protein
MPVATGDGDLLGRQAGQEPLLVLYTDDVTAARDRLLSRGVEIWAESQDPTSRSFHFRDLYGNILIAAQPTR